MDDCDRRPVFFGGVRRILRGGQWNLDAGRDGLTRYARNTSREWHQKLSRHLHQQHGRGRVFDFASCVVAAITADGRGRHPRRLHRGDDGPTRRTDGNSPRDSCNRICDYGGDALADEELNQRGHRENYAKSKEQSAKRKAQSAKRKAQSVNRSGPGIAPLALCP